MTVEKIRVSKLFEKQYKKLPAQIKELAKQKEFVFRANPFDSRLGIHKLHGKEKELWAFWINRSYRIKFAFLEKGRVLFLEIGTHEIYK
ncbi:MAG: type II toxin-antitoxin system mRNA interferase toxin, RelE/StbE family [Patescibacteria group bacterium]